MNATFMVLHLTRAGGRAVRNWIGAHLGQPIILDAPHRYKFRQWFKATQQKIKDQPVVANIEDMTNKEARFVWDTLQDMYFEERQPTYWFTVIRDPVNLIPSRLEYEQTMRFITNRRRIDRELMDTWMDHAVQGENQILYDIWHKTPEAYWPLMRRFGLNPIVKHLEYYPENQCSSFDDHHADGKCSKMDTLLRYKGYESFLLRAITSSVGNMADQMFDYREPIPRLCDPHKKPETFREACSW